MRTATIPGSRWTDVLASPTSVVLPFADDDRRQWALLAVLAAVSLVGLLLAGRATTARTRARTEQADTDNRLRMTVQNGLIGMTMVDLDHTFVEPNDRLCSMLGYSADELGSMSLDEVTHADDIELDEAFVHQLLAGEIDHYELEKRYVRSDGSVLVGRLAVSLLRGGSSKPLYFVTQIEDVTQFRAAQAELEYRARYDPLTGLANRWLLMDRLSNTLDDTAHAATTAVGLCDVDHFRHLNDVHGQHVGDEILKEVARRLRSAVRTADTVARTGADEFVILLSEVSSPSEAELVVQRASRAVEQPIVVDTRSFSVSLSVGLALGEAGWSADVLLGDADVALSAAREGGLGRCVVYHPALRDTWGAPLHPGEVPPPLIGTEQAGHRPGRMDELIRYALDHDAVGVAYQPVFDLTSGALVGTEALLRLNDPAGRPLPPKHVIPAAESSGLIVDLGRRVLQLAARQAAAWHQQHGVLVPVAVNVSATQLGLGDFPQEVLTAVDEAGVPTRALMLELTESVLLETGSAGMEQLSDLQKAGIELAIDDFGTGYASLSLLHELPAATLKIDQSFVAGIPHDERATTIVAGVIALAKNFHMSCIAEGIETESQRRYLAERGVLGQGYLLGIPDDATAIGRLIEASGGSTRPPLDGSAALGRARAWGHDADQSDLHHDRPHVPAPSGGPAPDAPSLPVDGVTGVYAREAGHTELTRELARARRTAEPLVLAVVILDDLEAVERCSGAAAAQRLLRVVAGALQVAVRPYDLVIRDTSNQFVSAITGLSVAEWERRLHRVDADIRERAPHASVRIGLAQMRAGDSGPTLIARAQSPSEAFRVGTSAPRPAR